MKQVAKLKALDVMQREVATLDAAAPIREAIETLEDLDITGAPVLDGEGKLVGMLTSRDVARAEHVRRGRLEPEPGEFAMSEPTDEEPEPGASEDVFYDKDDFSPSVRGSETVGDWMNRKLVVVGPDASLKDVCRAMLSEHIHRVVVADDGRLKGVITSFDVVRLVAESA